MKAQKSLFIRGTHSELEKIQERHSRVADITGVSLEKTNTFPFDVSDIGSKNCENIVGSVSVPVGVAGPVSFTYIYDGLSNSVSDVVLPLATTEGALVASINRGARSVAAATEAVVEITKIGMSRAPVFLSTSSAAATEFISWVTQNQKLFYHAANKTSAHLKYLSLTTYQVGKHSFVRAVFDTDEAMGMNMVSKALEYWWNELVSNEIKRETQLIAISGNVCGDKKPAQLTKKLGRGYWVTTKVLLSEEVLEKNLHTNSESLLTTHKAKNSIGSKVAGIYSPNMHVANAVAALFIALGQDLAHVVDVASNAEVSFKKHTNGIEVLLEMPSVPVGSVGGGTSLPQQRELQTLILGSSKDKTVRAVNIAAAVGIAAVCGELSGLAALTTHSLVAAHIQLGRNTVPVERNK